MTKLNITYVTDETVGNLRFPEIVKNSRDTNTLWVCDQDHFTKILWAGLDADDLVNYRIRIKALGLAKVLIGITDRDEIWVYSGTELTAVFELVTENNWIALTDALGDPYVVYYQTIKLTNNTDADVPLKVKLTAKTDQDKVYRGTIDPIAKKALEKKTKKTYKSATEIFKGKLAPKESIDAVVFYGKTDLEWDKLTVSVTGLLDPIDKVDGKLFYEKKVLKLSYDRPGDEFERTKDDITFKGSKWELIGERKEIPQKPTK